MSSSTDFSKLDQEQIIKLVVDEDGKRLRTSAEVSFPPSVDVGISHTEDSIRLGDGTDLVTTSTEAGKVGLDVSIIKGSITGEFSPTGLRNALKTSRIAVTTTTPIAIPATPQTDRNGMSIRNLGPNVVWIAGSITDTPGLAGTSYPKNPGEEIFLDIRDDIVIYACVETGQTANLAIMEVS
jgi:hypothetical protein